MQPGQILLHYRIVEKIGEGGMGQVYLAEDTKLCRQSRPERRRRNRLSYVGFVSARCHNARALAV